MRQVASAFVPRAIEDDFRVKASQLSDSVPARANDKKISAIIAVSSRTYVRKVEGIKVNQLARVVSALLDLGHGEGQANIAYPLRGSQEAADHLEGCSLACAVGADKSKNFTGGNPPATGGLQRPPTLLARQVRRIPS